MKSFEWYKEKYGDGVVEFTSNNTLSIPGWLVRYLLDMTGLKSKKTRIQKKVLKREVMRALHRGAEIIKENKDV